LDEEESGSAEAVDEDDEGVVVSVEALVDELELLRLYVGWFSRRNEFRSCD
jgi:hypothetical protein